MNLVKGLNDDDEDNDDNDEIDDDDDGDDGDDDGENVDNGGLDDDDETNKVCDDDGNDDDGISIQLLLCLNGNVFALGAAEELQLVTGTVVVDVDDDVVTDGTNVSGTKCGVRLDIGGKIGLVGHWYDGVVAEGTLLKK